MKILLVIFILVFSSCTTTLKETVRDSTFHVASPTISDSLPFSWDFGNITGSIVTKHDTTVFIRVDTTLRKIYLRVKPDTISFTLHDTTNSVINNIIETSFWTKLGLFFGGVAVGSALLAVMKYTKGI